MSFIGVVLAGGQSKRMGSDKALLSLNGHTMLSRTIDCLKKAGAKQVIVSRNGQDQGAIADIHPHKGPLSGIHAAALQFASHPLLLLPVDLPLVCAQELKKLHQHGQRYSCSCHFNEHNLPLYLLTNQHCIDVLEHILLHGDDYSVANFIRQIGAQSIEAIDPKHLVNTNTPEQWQDIQQAIINP